MKIKTNLGVYTSTPTVIPYEVQLNIGWAMNATTGIFTALSSGRYFFSLFTALSDAAISGILLRKNQVNIGQPFVYYFQTNMPFKPLWSWINAIRLTLSCRATPFLITQATRQCFPAFFTTRSNCPVITLFFLKLISL